MTENPKNWDHPMVEHMRDKQKGAEELMRKYEDALQVAHFLHRHHQSVDDAINAANEHAKFEQLRKAKGGSEVHHEHIGHMERKYGVVIASNVGSCGKVRRVVK